MQGPLRIENRGMTIWGRRPFDHGTYLLVFQIGWRKSADRQHLHLECYRINCDMSRCPEKCGKNGSSRPDDFVHWFIDWIFYLTYDGHKVYTVLCTRLGSNHAQLPFLCGEEGEGETIRPSWGRISTWFVYLPLRMKHVENSWFTGRLRASHQSICWSGSWQTQSLACSYFQRPIERLGSQTRVYYPWLQEFFRSWESPLHNCFFLVFFVVHMFKM